VGGVNLAGRLLVSGSVRKETLPSILIGQFYPLVLLSALLLAIALIVGHEATKLLPTGLKKINEL